MEKFLIIVRGIPGSGKSKFATQLAPNINICTADDFFMIDGKYCWKPNNVKKAHQWCQEKAETLMKKGSSPVVVANTSTTEKELQPYYDLAERYKYTVFSVIVENRHGGVNQHDVPEETLLKMRERFHIKL